MGLNFTIGGWTIGWVPVYWVTVYLATGQTIRILLWDFWKEDGRWYWQTVDKREALGIKMGDLSGYRRVKRYRLAIVKLSRRR